MTDVAPDPVEKTNQGEPGDSDVHYHAPRVREPTVPCVALRIGRRLYYCIRVGELRGCVADVSHDLAMYWKNKLMIDEMV